MFSMKTYRTGGLALAAGLLSTGASAAPADAARPNILFIAADDMKPLIGAYGDSFAKTPNLDRLASRGMVFINNQCQWAVCGPSRASLMTSLMPETTGVIGFKQMRAVIPDVVTLPQYLKENGYETVATGKIYDPRCVEGGRETDDPLSWSLPYRYGAKGGAKEGRESSAAPNIPDSQHEDGQICDEGLKLMDQLSKGEKPFFLAVGFKKPHIPFVAPKRYWDMYDRSQIPLAVYQKIPLGGLTRTWNGAKEFRTYDDVPKEGPFPEDKQRELIHGYYACISLVDAQVGRLLARLEELGLDKNTIVVFWGDHGYHLGDHAEWGKHTNMEQAARAPLIIAAPGLPAGKNVHPSGFIDLYPTLCELVGLEIPEQTQGLSLVPMLRDPNARVRNGAFCLFRREGSTGYAYRTDRYRYIEWVKGKAVDARELYDYETDPNETVNLAANPEYTTLMKELAAQMREEGVGCDLLLGTN